MCWPSVKCSKTWQVSHTKPTPQCLGARFVPCYIQQQMWVRYICNCFSARSPFLLQGVEGIKCACLLTGWCDALWQAENSLGATCTLCSRHWLLLPTLLGKIFTDASIRTRPLMKSAYWLTVDASSKSVLNHRDKRMGIGSSVANVDWRMIIWDGGWGWGRVLN